MFEKFTVEVTDPPPGWNDRDVEVRHRLIPRDQLELASYTLLRMAHVLWIKAGRPGKAAPSVRVRVVDSSSHSSRDQ